MKVISFKLVLSLLLINSLQCLAQIDVDGTDTPEIIEVDKPRHESNKDISDHGNKSTRTPANSFPVESDRDRIIREMVDERMKNRTYNEIFQGLIIGEVAQRNVYEKEIILEILEKEKQEREKAEADAKARKEQKDYERFQRGSYK